MSAADRFHRHSDLIMNQCLVCPSQHRQSKAEVALGFGKHRFEPKRFLELVCGFSESPLLHQRAPEILAGNDITGSNLYCVSPQRLTRAPESRLVGGAD